MSNNILRAGKVMCRPATKLIEIHQQRKTEIEQGLRRNKPIPRALKRRRRALTWQESKAVQSQDNSLLLAKLPLELRQLIWIECVGKMTVHLKIWDRRLRSVCCRCPEMPRCKHLRHYDTPDDEQRPLAVLLTCQQVYSEAVDFLYSQNIFKVVNKDCLAYLPQLMLPQRINTIRHIRFQWFLQYAPNMIERPSKKCGDYDWAWASIWQILASMQALEHLWIYLDIHSTWKHEWIERQSVVFDPIKAVTTPKHFNLVIPFSEELEQETLAGLPCHIPLPGES